MSHLHLVDTLAVMWGVFATQFGTLAAKRSKSWLTCFAIMLLWPLLVITAGFSAIYDALD